MPTTKAIWQPPWSRIFLPAIKFTGMFNPHEYTVSKQNQWDQGKTKGKNAPKVKFAQGGAENAQIAAFLRHLCRRQRCAATYRRSVENDEGSRRQEEPAQQQERAAPCAFRWGQFEFQAVITSLSQSFTLFDKDGLPLRTTVDVSFQQVEDSSDFGRQNPTSGGGARRQDSHCAGRRAAGLDRRPGLRRRFAVAIDCARQSHHSPPAPAPRATVDRAPLE